MDRRDRIREIYQEEHEKKDGQPFDRLWDWAQDGESKLERYRRFRALQKWAKQKRETKESRDGDTYKQWTNRMRVYRRKARKILTRINDSPALGTGPLEGTTSIIEHCVIPVYTRFGAPVTSRKRWDTFGNPSSDHYWGNRDADAADGGRAEAYEIGRSVGEKITAAAQSGSVGYSGYADDFKAYYVEFAGERFRVQIIARTHGTGPHIHTGVKNE
jgi:hypothetical protein